MDAQQTLQDDARWAPGKMMKRDLFLATILTLGAYFVSLGIGLYAGHLVFSVSTEGALQAWMVQIVFNTLKTAVAAAVFGFIAGRALTLPPFSLGLAMGVAVVLPEIINWPSFLNWVASVGSTGSLSVGAHITTYISWLASPTLFAWFTCFGRNRARRAT